MNVHPSSRDLPDALQLAPLRESEQGQQRDGENQPACYNVALGDLVGAMVVRLFVQGANFTGVPWHIKRVTSRVPPVPAAGGGLGGLAGRGVGVLGAASRVAGPRPNGPDPDVRRNR